MSNTRYIKIRTYTNVITQQVLDLSEDRAMEHFRLKFIEAVKNSWTTTVNWTIHNIDKNNWQWPVARRLKKPSKYTPQTL